MSSTVSVGGMEITSNFESAESMVESLRSKKDDAKEPRVLMDDGQPVKQDPEEQERSKAAAVLGKKGGEAAAKARAEKETAEPEEKAAAGDGKEAAEPEGKAGNPRHDARARVEQATRQLAEERRQRAEDRRIFEERLARLEAAREGPQERQEAPQKAQPASADGKPKVDDYATYEEYVEALTEWKTDQKLAARQKAETEAQESRTKVESTQQVANAFFQRIEKAIQADPDFMSRVDAELLNLDPSFTVKPGQQATVDHYIADNIIASEAAPELLLHLTEHPEDLEGLRKAPNPWVLAKRFGALEDKVTAKPAAEPERKPSGAPPPIKPLASSAPKGEPDIYGDLDFDTFAARKGGARARR